MGWYVPRFGPDAGRLVRRDTGEPSAASVPDEAALDAVIPGRAAIRECYAPTNDAAERGRLGAEGAAALLRRERVQRGEPDPGPDLFRERVNQARQSANNRRSA